MDLATRTRVRLRVVVGLLVVMTIGGMVALRPTGDLPGDTQARDLTDGIVVEFEPYEAEASPFSLDGRSARMVVELTSGPDRGDRVMIDQLLEGLPVGEGTRVRLDQFDMAGEATWIIVDLHRSRTLWFLGALFIGVVLAIGRWHGLRSLLGLGLSLAVVVQFIVPAILSGRSPALVALVGAAAIMLVTLYLSHGVNEQTTAAVVGTTIALGVTLWLGSAFIERAALTGYASEDALFAAQAVAGLDLRGLILAGLIIGALGVLDDVTVSQASTVFALHDTDPRLSVAQVTRTAMRVGRDHIASTVNTLFLAYAGASLALLVLFSTSGRAAGDILTSEIVAEEIVKTLVGSLGLILAVPVTTLLAATLAVRRSREDVAASRERHGIADPTGHGHRHG